MFRASSNEQWAAAEPAPARLTGVVQEILDYFGLGNVSQWEVRIADTERFREEWTDVDAKAFIIHGNSLDIMVNPAMGQEARKTGLYQRVTLIHEVLHYLFYHHESLINRLLGEDTDKGVAVYESCHDLLDRLSWILVDHIFPEYNPEEDILVEN